MGLFDTYAESGLLGGLGMSPKAKFEHQIIIDDLNFGLKLQLDPKKYRVLSETQIDANDPHTIVPDLVVFKIAPNFKDYTPILFIEIEHTKRIKQSIKKVDEAMKRYSIREAFIYDYNKKEWKKNVDITLNSEDFLLSYSNLLNLDLAQFIKAY